MRTFEDHQSGKTEESTGDVETGASKWRWPLSDEEWKSLQEYLSQTEEGRQRLQTYEQNRKTDEIPSCINADQWESQWHEDLRQAGIPDHQPVR